MLGVVPSYRVQPSVFASSTVKLSLSRLRQYKCQAEPTKKAQQPAIPATPPADDDFEAKLAKLSGRIPKRLKQEEKKKNAPQVRSQLSNEPDAGSAWDDEVVFWEGRPAIGDLIGNILGAFTLIWIPLTLAAVVRYLTLYYKITDKRICLVNNSPFGGYTIDIPYEQVEQVDGAGRFVGLWGDIVLSVQAKKDKVEVVAVPNWLEIRDYIQKRADECNPLSLEDRPSSQSAKGGF